MFTITLTDGTPLNETYAGRTIVEEDRSGWWLGRMWVTDGTRRLTDAHATLAPARVIPRRRRRAGRVNAEDPRGEATSGHLRNPTGVATPPSTR